MKILHQFKHPNFKPSKKDQILFKFIQDDANFFCTNPIATLARHYGVSEASITRFVRKMGFESLQKFKLTLTEELSINKSSNIINKNIIHSESIKETASKLLMESVIALNHTVDNIDSTSLLGVVKLIQNARRIFFIGLGNSGFVADDSAYKLMRIGLDVSSINNSHLIMLQMAVLHPDDLVIAISHSGNTHDIIKAAQLAKKAGAKFVAITSNTKSPIVEYCNYILTYQSGETLLETGSITTKLTQIFIIDLLYTQIVKDSMVVSQKFKTQTAEAIRFLYDNLN